MSEQIKERPILFGPKMVRAERGGYKEQTRRVVQWNGAAGLNLSFTGLQAVNQADRRWLLQSRGMLSCWTERASALCPYGTTNDLLWIREAWVTERRYDELKPCELPADARIWFLADGPGPAWAGRYRNARFLCRTASRTTLRVVGVRVERLKEITAADATLEGVCDYRLAKPCPLEYRHVDMFGVLWELIHGPGSWDANPWVWVITFERVWAKTLDGELQNRSSVESPEAGEDGQQR